ncbi:MAG: carboxypeptidase regulatory-like domain-containing protein [Vicinamibacterales bacterium]
MTVPIVRLVMVSGLLALPVAAWAQTVVSGTIAGVVTDTTGAVLPGVTIEAASPALIEKVRAAVTDDRGLYRIVDLRPGVYTVTFTLPGFSTFRREGLELTTAFTATVNAELRVGALEETVTVTGESPVVDIQNVMQQKVFTREVVDQLPAGGNVNVYSALVPGAVLATPNRQDVGGNQGEQDQGFGIHGGRQADFVLMREGMVQNTLLGSGNRTYSPNPAATAEITVETSGMSAESETGGVHINMVPKAGGNTFSGSFVSTMGHKDLQGANVTDRLRARGVGAQPEIRKLFDVNLGVGGPIKKDTLWFFAAQRWFHTSSYLPGNYYNKLQGTLFYEPDVSRPAFDDDYYGESSLRLTWQVAQEHKVDLGYIAQKNCNCMWAIQNGLVAPEAAGAHNYNPNYVAQATWTHPATSRLLVESGGTLVVGTIQNRLTGGTYDDYSVLEQSRNYRYGSRGSGLGPTAAWGNQSFKQANQRVTVSYITGSHTFKSGLYALEALVHRRASVNHDLSYTFRNGVPQSVTYWATPYEREGRVRSLGLYAQDQWTIRQLTLNVGLRFDSFSGWVPELHLPAGRWVPARDFPRVENVPNWKDVSPRLGAAYDLFGTGKTALKVFVGRYVAWQSTGGIVNDVAPVNTSVNSATRAWNDLNGDYVPQENELGPLSPANFGQSRITTRFANDVTEGFGNRGYNWQASAAIQHELRPGIALNVAYFRTWYGNFLVTDNQATAAADYDPYCITAPKDSRLPGGGGGQICGLYNIGPAKFGQINNLITQASRYGTQSEVFNGIDVTINARFAEGGMISGGLSTGGTVYDTCDLKSLPHVQPMTVLGVAASTTVVTPKHQEFCHVGTPWSAGTQVKLSAIYPLPWGLLPSVAVQSLPGVPITTSYVATSTEIAPSLGRNLAGGVRNVELELINPRIRFEDRFTQVDVRLGRIVRIGRMRVQGMFDVYNVLNASPVLGLNTRYGAAWLDAQQILAARMFKVGAQFHF